MSPIETPIDLVEKAQASQQQPVHPPSPPPNMKSNTIFRQSPHHTAYNNLPHVVSVRIYLSDAVSPSIAPAELLSLVEEIQTCWQKARTSLPDTFKKNITCSNCKIFGPVTQATAHPMPKYLQERVNDIVESMRIWGEDDLQANLKDWKSCEKEMDVLEEFVRRWCEVEHMFLELNLNSRCHGLFGQMNPAAQQVDYTFSEG